MAKSTATFGAATGSPEKAISVGPFNRGAIEATSRAFKSDLGEAVLRDLHGGARLLHLPAQSLHLGHGEAGIVSDDDDLRGLEDLAERRRRARFFSARSTQLSPVGGPFIAEAAGLMPAVRLLLALTDRGRTTLDTLPPGARFAAPGRRGSEPKGERLERHPGSSPVYAGHSSARIKPLPAPAVSDRTTRQSALRHSGLLEIRAG